MALLLNVRRLGSESDDRTTNGIPMDVEIPCKEDLDRNLLPEAMDSKSDCSIVNPAYVTDQSDRDGITTFVLPFAVDSSFSSKESNGVHNENIRGLRPSDSGIHISPVPSTDDMTSLRSSKSLDSGVYGLGACCDVTKQKVFVPSKIDLEKSDQKEFSESNESLCSIFVQVLIPFLIAGIGTCGAGLVYDHIEEWDVFTDVTELYILTIILLGLKGNLEMTLASRVSTQANLGKLDTSNERLRMFWGNMALVQCQASAMSLLSSSFVTIVMVASSGHFHVQRALMISASGLFTASMASLGLGALTLGVVLLAHHFHINPDNVATPIAASVGDVTTLGIFAAITSHLHSSEGLLPSSLCLAAFVAMMPMWVWIAYRNEDTRKVLYNGWAPVIAAVAITSAAGYILKNSVSQFRGFSVFQPVINGVAGNLVAVQASRISTYFHKTAEPGSRPPDGSPICISPIHAFITRSPHSMTARLLLGLVIPGHILFGYGITLAKGGDTVMNLTFLPIYLASAFIQVASLLYSAQCLIHILWRWKVDPDNWAIPLLTALGDLSGTAALTLAFVLYNLAQESVDS